MATPPEPLDPLHFPLHGSRLIEASAGTGKTWTIAALYLRLVLGHGPGMRRALLPPQILVMTFTRAATRELRGRIRERLVQAAACLRADDADVGKDAAAADPFLLSLRATYAPGAARARAAWLLESAASGMDEAAIHTMDAWCQRTVREHALGGSLAEETLLDDEAHALRDATHDYWRQNCACLPDALLPRLLDIWGHAGQLLADVARLLPLSERVTQDAALADMSLAQCLEQHPAQHRQAVRALAQGWPDRAQRMRQWLDGQLENNGNAWNKKKLVPVRYRAWCQHIADWAEQPRGLPEALTPAARHRLSPAGLAEACLSPPQTLELPPEFAQLQTLLQQLAQLPTLRSRARRHACAWIGARLAWIKRQGSTFSHNDMARRLLAALEDPHGGPALRARLLAQYPVSLIDEFQDTSPQQYRLFEHIYRTRTCDPASALLLIGDPKQSIYGFRDADIYSYLQARADTEGRHYRLETNHRSSSALVQAVNHLFTRAEAREEDAGAFLFRRPDGNNPLPFVPVQARGRPETLCVCAIGPAPGCAAAPPAPPAGRKSPG